MTQEEFDKSPKLDQILYDCTGMLTENHSDIVEAMEQYAQSQFENINTDDLSVSLPSDELIEQRGQEFESKTYYNLGKGEKIGDFENGAKWVVDYLQGNQR